LIKGLNFVGKKRLRQKISSLEKRIKEHKEKVATEKSRIEPDEGLIFHWEREIRAFQEALDKAKKRLGGER
jgi:chromosome segregation ATPase